MSEPGEKIRNMTIIGLVIWLLIGGILPSQGGCQDGEHSFVWCLEDPDQPGEWVMGVDATGTLYLKGELLPSENVNYRLLGISPSDIIWKVKKNPVKTVAAVYLNPDTLLYDLAIAGDLLENVDISSYWRAKDYWTIKEAGELILALKKQHSGLPDGSLLLAKGVTPRAAWSDPETYVIESAENYYAWVVLDRVSDSTVSVDYSTIDGTALDGIDYTGVSGTLSFSPGDTSGTIVVPILNNSTIDGDLEFSLEITGCSSNLILNSTQQAITIIDEDPAMPSFVDVDVETQYIASEPGIDEATIYVGINTGIQLGENEANIGVITFHGNDSMQEYCGLRLSAIGDVNGDGYDDIAVGAPASYYFPSMHNPGKVYLIFGTNESDWIPSLDGIDLSSSANASYIGEEIGDGAGWDVDGVGDVNADGYDDFVIGARFSDYGANNGGQAYLVLGKPSGWVMDATLGQADAFFLGEALFDSAGMSTCGLGDVNGDGLDDFLIAAPYSSYNTFFAGQSYLILGTTNWSNKNGLDWTNPNARQDLSKADAFFLGEAFGDSAGLNQWAAGDVNGDGVDDLLIASPGNSEGGLASGQCYLIFGVADWLEWASSEARLDLSNADASFLGESSLDAAGTTVAGVGDVNGDGLDDFLIGAANNGYSAHHAGQSYLILGKPSGWVMDATLGQASAFLAGQQENGFAGWQVAGSGDYNGDGFTDLLIGAPYDDTDFPQTGRVYLVDGTSDWSEWDGTGGRKTLSGQSAFIGRQQGDWGKSGISSAGDVNGDGIPDLIIGAAEANSRSGKAVLWFGEGTVPSATYRTYASGGWMPKKKGVGSAGDGSNSTPASRCWVQYPNGSGPSLETVTIDRGQNQDQNLIHLQRNAGAYNGDNYVLDRAVTLANVSWIVSTTRADWSEVSLTFKYTDAEISNVINEYPDADRPYTGKLDESSLVVYYNASPYTDNTYYPLLTEKDRQRNRLSVVVNSSSLPARFVVGGWDSMVDQVPVVEVDNDTDGRWSFAIWGDPQVGTKRAGFYANCPYRWYNWRFYRTMDIVNAMNSEFAVTMGDIINQAGQVDNFEEFVKLVNGEVDYSAFGIQSASADMPVYCLMGNHDHNYDSGYALTDPRAANPYQYHEFGNFMWLQEKLNERYDGDLSDATPAIPRKVTYSFDAGEWHFILFPGPGTQRYGMNGIYDVYHPEYVEWLKADLAKNSDTNTMFFMHEPLLPTGQLNKSEYGPWVDNRNELLDILTEHGNVKFAFFGHIHNSLSSTPSFAWKYRGTRFITVPNTAYLFMKWFYNESYRSAWGPTVVTINNDTVESIKIYPCEMADSGGPIDPGNINTDEDWFIDTNKDWDIFHQWTLFGARVRIKTATDSGWDVDLPTVYNSVNKLYVKGDVPTSIVEYEIYIPIQQITNSGTISAASDYTIVDNTANWPVNQWAEGVLSVTDSSNTVHQRLVAGNSANSVTIYGREGALPDDIVSASYDLRFDNTVLTVYSATDEPVDYCLDYDDSIYGYLTAYTAIDATQSVVQNGDFEGSVRLLGWDDVQPANWYVNNFIHYATGPIRKRKVIADGATSSLYLYARATNDPNPSEPGFVSEVRQVISATPGMLPVVNLDFLIPEGQYVKTDSVGAYMAVSGFNSERQEPLATMVYTFGGRDWSGDVVNIYTPNQSYGGYSPIKLDLITDPQEGVWYTDNHYSVGADYNTSKDVSWPTWEDLNIDRIVLWLGVHNIDFYLPDQEVAAEIGTQFSNVSVDWESPPLMRMLAAREPIRQLPAPANIVISGTESAEENVYLDRVTISWDPIPGFDVEGTPSYYLLRSTYGGSSPALIRMVTDGTSVVISLNDSDVNAEIIEITGLEFDVSGVRVTAGGGVHRGNLSDPVWFGLKPTE